MSIHDLARIVPEISPILNKVINPNDYNTKRLVDREVSCKETNQLKSFILDLQLHVNVPGFFPR